MLKDLKARKKCTNEAFKGYNERNQGAIKELGNCRWRLGGFNILGEVINQQAT